MFLAIYVANKAGALGIPAQSGLPARHVLPTVGECGRHRLLRSQRKGPCDWKSAQTALEGGQPSPQGAGEVTGHVEQSAGKRSAGSTVQPFLQSIKEAPSLCVTFQNVLQWLLQVWSQNK